MTYNPEIFAAWAAGFFDGEGSVDAVARTGKGGSPSARCRIANVDPAPVEMFKEAFGGTISYYEKTKHFEWCIQGKDLDRFIELVLPHCVVKAGQLRLLQEFRKMMPGRGYRKISDHERWQERKRLAKLSEKIRELKWVRHNAV